VEVFSGRHIVDLVDLDSSSSSSSGDSGGGGGGGGGLRVHFRLVRFRVRLIHDKLLHFDQLLRELLPLIVHRHFLHDEPEPFHGDGEKRVRYCY